MLQTDLHSHILPGIDDGAKDVNLSSKMLDMLFSQGVEHVAVTPHFRSHKENVRHFCARRERAYQKLCAAMSFDVIERITVGAEVAIEYGISQLEDIEELAYEFTDYILLELPFRPFTDRLVEEINSVRYNHGLTPVLAHVDRYADIYKPDDYREIFALDDVVFQINNEAFTDRKARRVVDELISSDLPFVLGSDCHNITDRKPNFDISRKHLKKYTPHPKAQELLSYFS